MSGVIGKGRFSLPKAVACTSEASNLHPSLERAVGLSALLYRPLTVTTHMSCSGLVIVVGKVKIEVDARPDMPPDFVPALFLWVAEASLTAALSCSSSAGCASCASA